MMRRFTLLLAAILVGMATVIAPGVPAYAHSALRESAPRDGAVLAEPPSEITLVFNEKLQGQFTTIKVTTSDGAVVDVEKARTDGAKAIQLLPAALAAGEYTVAYRILSADGHPVTGKISFRTKTAASPSLPVSAFASGSAAPATSSAQPPAANTGLASVEKEIGLGPWLWVVGAVLVGIAGVLVVVRRRRDPVGN